ncbi:MAG: hypothetical protein Q9222_004846 [Ikaeria aurantiellina]
MMDTLSGIEQRSSPEELNHDTTASSGSGNHALSANTRVRYVTSEVDERGNRSEKAGKRTHNTVPGSKEDSNVAFMIKDYLDKNGNTEKTEVVLKGQDLRNIMYNVLRKHFEHDQNRNWLQQEQTINPPAHVELWYWSELSGAAKSNQGTEQGRQDLQILLDHLSDMMPEDVKLVKSISTMSRICTKDLWCLFRPGTLVVAKPFQDEPQLFRVHDSHFRGWSEDKAFVIEAWAFSWTGSELVQEYYTFEIREWVRDNEEMLIVDLPCYPLGYYRDSNGNYGSEAIEGLEAELFKRDCTAYKQYSLDGTCALGGFCPTKVVACKCELCFDQESNCISWMRRFAEEPAKSDLTAEDANYLLLPARVLGYCFSSKAWAQFHVRKVGAIEPANKKQMMDRLIFPEESASVKVELQVLIEQHGRTELPLIADPIKGKGAGLVVLLHGPPGVGKTLTAETFAKCAGKPLYVAGANDIGLEPKTAEATLRRLFELAERWGAVLLIDEADVFLDSRGSRGEADIYKNALVSIMLRVLEYFQGILVMTTNRVMTFDIAMLSRCHYAVNLKSLTLRQEKEIWQGYVDQLNEQNSSKKGDIEWYIKQITKNVTGLSGREIRNIFTTAQTLAQAEPSKKIEGKHLESVYDRLQKFSKDMQNNKMMQHALLNAAP